MAEITSTPGPFSTPYSATSINADPVLPLEARHHRISYRNSDGTLGEQAHAINFQELYNLKGRLLTLVDATFQDPQQRKAHKDMVWHILQAWMNDIVTASGYEPSAVTHHNDGDPQL